MKKQLIGYIAALFVVFGFAAQAQAQDPKYLGAFKDWHAFTLQEQGNDVCYMVSQPLKSEGNYTRRGSINVLVTHRPAERSYDVVSFLAGYTFKEGSKVDVKIGKSRFSLFTEGDTAWASDEKTDHALVTAIRSGAKMVVTGYSSRGTKTVDTYSLSGSSAAYSKISQLCNVKR